MKYFFILFLTLSVSFSKAGSLDKTISITVKDISLAKCLKEIERIAEVSFSYHSNHINQNRIVSITIQDKSLRYILNELLKYENVSFSELGNHIVIKKNPRTTNSKAKRKVITVIDTMTVEVYDSIMVYDTTRITILDTIRTIDTTFIVRSVTKLIQPKAVWFAGLQTGLRTELHRNTALEVRDENKYAISQQNRIGHAVNAYGGVKWDGLSVTAGIGHSAYNQDYGYSITHFSEHKKTHWIDHYNHFIDSTFIASPNVDTVWFTRPDSTLESYEEAYIDSVYSTNSKQGINKFTYLSIPITISYKWPVGKRFYIGGTAGIQTDFVLSASGEYVSEDKKQILELGSESLQFVGASACIMADFEWQFSQPISLTFSPSVLVELSPYSVNKESRSVIGGFSVGVKKYFK